MVEPSAVVEPAPEQVVEPAPEQAVEPAPEPPAVEPAPKVPRAPAPTASSEVELLRRAQALLAAQPGRALQLTNEHQRRFRDGVLAEEREALAIEALRRLGRAREAQRRAALFQRRYPSSVHTSRVRGSVAPPSTR